MAILMIKIMIMMILSMITYLGFVSLFKVVFLKMNTSVLPWSIIIAIIITTSIITIITISTIMTQYYYYCYYYYYPKGYGDGHCPAHACGERLPEAAGAARASHLRLILVMNYKHVIYIYIYICIRIVNISRCVNKYIGNDYT